MSKASEYLNIVLPLAVAVKAQQAKAGGDWLMERFISVKISVSDETHADLICLDILDAVKNRTTFFTISPPETEKQYLENIRKR